VQQTASCSSSLAALTAPQGHLHALFNVAMMHLNGFGTQRNCQLASTYLKATRALFLLCTGVL
jgi:TPR repeat protein